METPILKRKKTASQLLKEWQLTVEEAEQMFEQMYEVLEQNEKDEDE